jgi:hypothetical protein
MLNDLIFVLEFFGWLESSSAARWQTGLGFAEQHSGGVTLGSLLGIVAPK